MSHWPLFGLTIRTPRIELRYLDDEVMDELIEVAAAGIADDGRPMPFLSPWIRGERPGFDHRFRQWHWGGRARLTAEDWVLPFAILVDGALVGAQDLAAKAFPVARTVVTGSWLGLAHQGTGIGKEMRAAVLHLAFDGLGAQRAHTEAFEDNPRSLGVTRALGYEENGWTVLDREGVAAKELRFVMTRERWLERRRGDITIDGLTEDVLELLGLRERTADA
ncbi:MAG TPA: GNAT family protein [Acidimicrobiales bacterium]|nr:GNAT family protein [Acidimicrobiales bacterium]